MPAKLGTLIKLYLGFDAEPEIWILKVIYCTRTSKEMEGTLQIAYDQNDHLWRT